MKILPYLLFLLSVSELYTWKVFHRGRYFKGNLNFFNDDKNKTTRTVNEMWITQRLDHFNPDDSRTWIQRYFVDDQYYNPSSGGPVFLFIGGEGEIENSYMEFSWTTYAKKFGALCFVLEHRYYGKSRPTTDISTRNLQFLNSEQALADLASFIHFGGSYAGSLAAWLRLKYPDLVYGAISSSGPLLAQVDFRGYYKVVAESLRTYSQECVDEIQKAFLEVDHLLRSKNGQVHLTKIFQLFEPIEEFVHNISNVQNLYATLADYFAGLVQHYAFAIDSTCSIMTNSMVKKPVYRLAALIKGFSYRYDETISALRTTDWDNVVSGTSHCVDVYPETPTDLPQLKEARQKIAQYLSTWIEQ